MPGQARLRSREQKSCRRPQIISDCQDRRELIEQKKNTNAAKGAVSALFDVDKPIRTAIPAFIRRAAG